MTKLEEERKLIEARLEEISDTAPHLFPSMNSPYPVECGKVGLCLMRWIPVDPAANVFSVATPAHWEFTWWDEPLYYSRLIAEAGD